MQIFPTTLATFIHKAVDYASVMYLQQFAQAPPKFLQITVDVSPFSYTAKEPGYVVIDGGGVSAIHLIRGSDDLNLTGHSIIPVSINDIVRTTYSVLPTITFIPIYGAAPR